MAETDVQLEDMLGPYPETVKKNRKKHIIVKDVAAECCPQIEANTRTIPGIISQRGCAYAGCKGVVVGPIKDMVTITHGPVGCGYCIAGVPGATRPGRTRLRQRNRSTRNSVSPLTCRSLMWCSGGRKSLQK